MSYFLGIDQGTTLTTALVLNGDMQVVGRASYSNRQYHPAPGRAEQDPNEIFRSVLSAADAALDAAGIKATELTAIGIDHQGETCMLWDKTTLTPLGPAIGWQDRRTADEIAELAPEIVDKILNTTGLVADSYYSASKLAWMLKNLPGAADAVREGRAEAGTVNTYLMRRLCGDAYATDPTTGGRYMLMDLRTTDWDDELLSLFGIPKSMLPPIMDCDSYFGHTRPEVFFGASVPIYGSISDSNAALLGSGVCEPGVLKASYGTGCFMSLYTGERLFIDPHGRLTSTCCRRLGGRAEYSVCGAVLTSGATVEWLRKIGLIERPSDCAELAKRAKDGVYFVPAMTGLGTPYWNQIAKAGFYGIGIGTGREELVRAVLDGTAYRVNECIAAINALDGIKVEKILADGGMSRDDYLMQFEADITGVPVELIAEKETSGFGAACLAALGVGYIASPKEIKAFSAVSKRYEPRMREDRRLVLLAGWESAVKATINNK